MEIREDLLISAGFRWKANSHALYHPELPGDVCCGMADSWQWWVEGIKVLNLLDMNHVTDLLELVSRRKA